MVLDGVRGTVRVFVGVLFGVRVDDCVRLGVRVGVCEICEVDSGASWMSTIGAHVRYGGHDGDERGAC